ncbi:3beta-hydroxysteroid-dehydrogenase/decarboxylase isoform X2 [Nymphaea colorata]|uniref:3beta-hydroxysteroid-dehydrogenase/decarboxylase isoform X2 n=1 Tax=Nymphaea colorata TaxID=210225 RepID=UPI00129D84ED|nr:3beta-hydroxysteroid-dehydrogenase/decarboxylase isoform X2 [Nymphaea colorata]
MAETGSCQEMAASDEGSAGSRAELRTCVVLGGRSFVGRPLVAMLLRSREWKVRIADAGSSLVLDPDEEDSDLSRALLSGSASYIAVDIGDKSQLIRAFEGSIVVFHMDALSFTNDFLSQYKTIVQGTKNVIGACRHCRVKRLMYNGSADVVFDGKNDVHNVDERLPYPSRFEEVHNDLKAQAETLVLSANSVDGLVTCALRPANVFGLGDPYLLPLITSQAKAGRSKYIIGNGENMWDFTYVDNVAHAHICAEQALRSNTGDVAGKAFFITNGAPMKLWQFISLVLDGLGYERPTIHLPVKPVLLMTMLAEHLDRMSTTYRRGSSYLSLSAACQLSCTKTYDCSEAKRLLGYSPIVTVEEGITLTIDSCSHLVSVFPQLKRRDFSVPSKSFKLLGGGEVADIILWRDEQKTFVHILALFFTFYWFFLSERTLISSTAKLFQLAFIGLFIHGYLPSSIFGIKVQKISPSCFEVSLTSIRPLFVLLASKWNRGIDLLRYLAQGDDWVTCMKVWVWVPVWVPVRVRVPSWRKL